MERDGLSTIGQLRGLAEDELMKRYGVIGQRLYRLSRGQDARAVHPHQPAKSISSETTLDQDLYRYGDLEQVLWRQVESVSRSLKSKKLAGRTITLKLKPSRLKTVTRSATISAPTQMAHLIFERAAEMLKKEAAGLPYRLVGVGMSQLIPAGQVADEDLFERSKSAKSEAERAIDTLQKRFGDQAIKKGRSLKG